MSVTTTSGRWSSAAATREGAAALLAQAGEVEVVEAVSDLDGLLAAVERHRPDAVLTDIRMPPTKTTEGIDAARRIRRGGVRLRAPQGRCRGARLPVEGAGRRCRGDRPGAPGRRVRRLRPGPEGGGGTRLEAGPGGSLPPGPPHPPGTGRPRAAGRGEEQRRCSRVAVPLRARCREAHQLSLPQAGPVRGAERPSQGDGRPHVPARGWGTARRLSTRSSHRSAPHAATVITAPTTIRSIRRRMAAAG